VKQRIPPVYYCPDCEPYIKFDGLRDGNRAQFIPKRCSTCTAEGDVAKTGADR